ncbi:MAG TPA: acyloxyacyl hydrolase [Bacteroidales bacterium]|nr:acyloxyacyl hydrolase [Bacteroidales bacterium]
MYRSSQILILFIFNVLSLNGTPDTIPAKYIGARINYGFIIPHSAAIEAISHTKPYGFEISYNTLHTSFTKWKVFNAYWNSGFQAGYFNYQNPEVTGSAYLFTLFSEPVMAFSNRFQLTIRTGAGLSYHTKIYDETDNPTNFFFGSRLNFPLYVAMRLKYRVGEKTFLTLAGNYNHISNGGFKQPNKGMNFPTLSAGAEYFPEGIPRLERKYFSHNRMPAKGLSCIVQFLATARVLEKTDELPEKRVIAYGFHSRIAKQLTSFYALNVGSEIIMDHYIRETIERDSSDLDFKRLALTAGQDFTFGKVSFTQYFGFYVYSPFKARNEIYQKYELSYRINRNMMAGVFFKAHLQVAELSGFTVSWVTDWGKKNK